MKNSNGSFTTIRTLMAAGTIVALCAWFFLKSETSGDKDAAQHFDSAHDSSLAKGATAQKSPHSLSADSAQTESERTPAQQTDDEPSTGTGRELASLAEMSKTLYDYTRPEIPLSDLVDYLKRSRQEPVVTRNSNPYTGEMAIVRTQSPMPGTRYFHAQYFADENKKSFVQHMSFEYRPGVGAMGEARNEIQKAFAGAGSVVVNKPDYVRWTLENGYILWIKKMTADDLKDDPFNAYTKADVGTIRVAIEAEIHGDEEHKGSAH